MVRVTVLHSVLSPRGSKSILRHQSSVLPDMVRVTVLAFLLISLASISGRAQSPTEAPRSASTIDILLSSANMHLQKGEACFTAGNMDCARREFDLAIDVILESGLDVRSDKRLFRGWNEMIEKINRYQLSALSDSKVAGWKTQEYEGRPVEEKSQVDGESEEIATGPLTPDAFQRRFAKLRESFREKYGRDIVLTGADHGEHRRLYGRGSAYDIRARDLNREQVKFIIATGNKLGLRIKDFSTWNSVFAHNARVFNLGRPLDTLATGLHLHIDRMAPPKKKRVGGKGLKSTASQS